MTKKNKTILAYILLGWLVAGYPMYLLLSFSRILLSQTAVIGLGIFVFIVGTGIFIGGAEKRLREQKIDTLLNKNLGSKT
jgi:hypothetical protein